MCTQRYYDPNVARWLTRDPIGYAGGIDLYAYCDNDPVNQIDPSGLDSDDGESEHWYIWLHKRLAYGITDQQKTIDTFYIGRPCGVFMATLTNTAVQLVGGGADMGYSFSILGQAEGRLTVTHSRQDAVATAWDGVSVLTALLPGLKPRCFVAGTLVQMADGSTKPIEQVRIGESVLARDPQTGKTGAKKVEQTYVRQAPEVITVQFAQAGDQSRSVVLTLTGTPEHPVFTPDHGMVGLGDLGVGGQILTRAGPALIVVSTERERRNEGYTVYNLRVADDHTYFVGEISGGAWVHNADYNLTEIAKEIQEVAGRPKETIAVAHAMKGNQLHTIVASNYGFLDALQMELARVKGLTYIGDLAFPYEHAEELMFRVGEEQGFDFNGQKIGVSHYKGVCVECEPLIRSRKMRLSGTRFSKQKFNRVVVD